MGRPLQSRKQCFYCGQKSSKPLLQSIRSWQCENCQAVNYLDENGQITDPPVEDVASSAQAAQRFANPVSSTSTDSTLFCAICLKNQQLMTELLSNYLPQIDHREYPSYVARYPQYRKELEQRYPQVCAKCEPRVRERIQQTGYAAKTDHLRRLMQRSRQRRISYRWGWRSIMLRVGAIGQLLSLATHMFWAATMILTGLNEQPLHNMTVGDMSMGQCLLSQPSLRHLPPPCLRLSAATAGWALLLAALTIWWNPKWHLKIDGRDVRLRGLRRYYRLQALSLLTRFAVWVVCQDYYRNNAKPLWVVQVVTTPLVAIFSVVLLRAITVETPSVSWQTELPPSLTSEPSIPPTGNNNPNSTALPSTRSASSRHDNHKPFPVGKLSSGTSPSRPLEAPPAPTDNAADAMEWEPSQSFRPTTYGERYPQKPLESSPFYGRLPPAPNSRLLHNGVKDVPPPRDSIGLAPGHFDRPPPSQPATLPPEMGAFAQPTFFPQRDSEIDTGLENAFEAVFSLRDEPYVSLEQNTSIQADPLHEMTENAASPISVSSELQAQSFLHLAASALLFALLTTWYTVDWLHIREFNLKLGITGVSAIIGAFLLIDTVHFPDKSSLDMCLYLILTLSSAISIAHRYQGGYAKGAALDDLVMVWLAIMIGHEVNLGAFAVQEKNVASITKNKELESATEWNETAVPTSLALPPAAQDYKESFSSSAAVPNNASFSTTGFPSSSFSSRPRTDSMQSSTSADSGASSVETTTTTFSVATPGFRNAAKRGQSPGFGAGPGLGSLRLDDTAASPLGQRAGRNLRSTAFDSDRATRRR